MSFSHDHVMLISLPSTIHYQFTVLIHLSPLMMTSTALILAVCSTPFTYELSYVTLRFMSSHSSVDRAPTCCSEGHGFNSCWGLQFFLCPMLM